MGPSWQGVPESRSRSRPFPHVNEPACEPQPDNATRLASLPGDGPQDHLRQHRHDAPEHFVAGGELGCLAESNDAADVECGSTLGRRPTSQPLEPRFLSRAELTSSLCSIPSAVLRQIDIDARRG